jgi:hypothetical protein
VAHLLLLITNRSLLVTSLLKRLWFNVVQFKFTIMDPSVPGDLEVNVQNDRNSVTGRRSSFLGKVVVPVNTVPPKEESIRWYPLQKRGLFSHIKGDLGSVSPASL